MGGKGFVSGRAYGQVRGVITIKAYHIISENANYLFTRRLLGSTPEIEEIAHKRRYFLILIGGGINPSKKRYRDQEMELMIEKLRKDKNKIPTPSRDDMMQMFSKAWNDILKQIDGEHVFKKNKLTIKFDGSEDHLVNRRLWDLVGDEMVKFRGNLLRSPPKSTLKGVKRKSNAPGIPPEDEGFEIFDGEEREAEEYARLEGGESGSEEEAEEEEAEEEEAEKEAAEMDTEEPHVEEDVSQNDNAGGVVMVDKNLEFLDQIRKLVSGDRKNSELSKELLPYLVKIDNLLSTARRKYLKEKANLVTEVVPEVHVVLEESEDQEFPPIHPIPPLSPLDDFDLANLEDINDFPPLPADEDLDLTSSMYINDDFPPPPVDLGDSNGSICQSICISYE